MATTPVEDRKELTPKCRKAAERIAELVDRGELRTGAFLPGERVLAAMVGVSRPTLRLVLDELERQGVVGTEARKGRFLASRPIRAGSILRSSIVILSDSPDPDDPAARGPAGFITQIGTGAIAATRAGQFSSLTVPSEMLEGEALERLIVERPMGAVVFCERMKLPNVRQLMARLAASRIPAVTFGSQTDYPQFDTVDTDHEKGCYELTSWLLERGCRRILRYWPLGGHDGYPAWTSARDAGYERALRKARLKPLPPVVTRPEHTYINSQTRFETKRDRIAGSLVKHLTGPKPVDAILSVSDGDVPAIVAACRLFGREQGRDISIVGYDNYWADTWERAYEATPPLATVDKRNRDIGRAMVDLLLARIRQREGDQPAHRQVSPKLVVFGGIEA